MMEIKIIFAVLYTMMLLWYHNHVNGRLIYPTAPNVFILFASLLFLGTLIVADTQYSADLQWLLIQLIGMLCFISGCLIVNLFRKTTPRREFLHFIRKPAYFDVHSGVYLLTLFIAAISILVVAVFIHAYEHHVLLESLQYAKKDISIETYRHYSEVRRSVSFGETYLGIGYVRQFANVLLPLVVYLVYFRLIIRRNIFDKAFFVLLIVFTIFSLTITGQRAPAVWFALIFILLLSKRFGPLGDISGMHNGAKMLVMALAIFAVGSLVLTNVIRGGIIPGRPWGMLVNTILDVWRRFAVGLAEEKLVIMRHIFDQPVTWGRDWFESLASILPGQSRELLAIQLHVMLYGSLGNAPLEFWGSTWHNFGWLGITIVTFLLGMVMQKFSFSTFQGERNITRSVVFFIIGINLGGFIDPLSLFNNGVITLVIFYYLLCAVKRFDLKIWPRVLSRK